MRVLLISHDYPPIRTPQSVRALSFSAGLSALGFDVHVLTSGGTGASGGGVGKVTVHRVSSGWLNRALSFLSLRWRRAAGEGVGPEWASEWRGRATLNWKGALVKRLRLCFGALSFPDATRPWVAHARAELGRLFAGQPPDCVVLMHEPASVLLLANTLTVKRIPWVADLADPVLTSYVRPWWRWRARRLEANILNMASKVIVTNDSTKKVLAGRHAIDDAKFAVIGQGYSALKSSDASPSRSGGSPLMLLYTGRFYTFRRPDALLKVIAKRDDVVLTIAGPEMPEVVLQIASAFPDKVILLGEVPNEEARRLQSLADVVVTVGNAGTPQSPGKFYEYFGACRPILNIQSEPGEEMQVLNLVRRGLSVSNRTDAIELVLDQLVEWKLRGVLDEQFVLDESLIEQFSWTAAVKRLSGVLDEVAKSGYGDLG